MRLYRNFFRYSSEEDISAFKSVAKPGADGRLHLAMFSDFFSGGRGRIMRTNGEYCAFRKELMDTVGNVSTVMPITIDVFEENVSEETDRETALIGFRKYIASCYYSFRSEYIGRVLLFTLFLVLGLAVIFLLYTVGGGLPEWLFYSFETIATVFVWQFAGYAAFEWASDLKKLRRYRQLTDVKFTFKHWE